MTDGVVGTRPSSGGRRHQVLQVLRDADKPVRIADIAAELGVHANTVRFHVGALVETGQVVRVDLDHTGPGRPPLMFRTSPGMDPAGPRHYRLLAEILVRSLDDSPDPAGKAVEAGRAWARTISSAYGNAPTGHARSDKDAVGRLVGLLDDLGFAPETPGPAAGTPVGTPVGLRVGLRHCPFLELAQRHPEVICPIHLGLMQGSLAAWDAPLTVERLEPFAEPDVCLAHLAPSGPPDPDHGEAGHPAHPTHPAPTTETT